MINKIFWCSMKDLMGTRERLIIKDILENNEKFTIWRDEVSDRIFLECKNKPKEGLYSPTWRP